jgi:hypothetical protein
MGFQRFGIVMTGLLALAGAAQATTTYSTAAAFNAGILGAGLSVAPTITFTSDVCSLCATELDSGVLFTSDTTFNIQAAGGWANGNVLEHTGGAGTITIAPSATFYAFGLDIVNFNGSAFPIDVQFNDGTDEDISLTLPSVGSGIFVGAIATQPITGLKVMTPFTAFYGIDDVQIGSQSATPEGSTMLLIGLGLIVLHLFHRRRANVVG